jgi:hypothetical protein
VSPSLLLPSHGAHPLLAALPTLLCHPPCASVSPPLLPPLYTTCMCNRTTQLKLAVHAHILQCSATRTRGTVQVGSGGNHFRSELGQNLCIKHSVTAAAAYIAHNNLSNHYITSLTSSNVPSTTQSP